MIHFRIIIITTMVLCTVLFFKIIYDMVHTMINDMNDIDERAISHHVLTIILIILIIVGVVMSLITQFD